MVMLTGKLASIVIVALRKL